MTKRMVFFERIPGASREWPEELRRRFARHFSRFDVVHFAAGSPDLEPFESALRDSGVAAVRRELAAPSRRELLDFDFHFLTPKSDRDYPKGDLFDTTPACPGNGTFHCGVGATQVRRPIIDAERSKSFDLMLDPGWPRPFVYLVSRRLAGLLEASDFSGFRLVPCLIAGREYSDDEMALDFDSAPQRHEATHFQLIVTGRAPGRAWVGEVLYTFAECKRCGTIHGAIFESMPQPGQADLDPSLDFQLLWQLSSANRGSFTIRGEHLLVSARVLGFLLANKVTGLGPYLTDPPVKHGVVEWRQDT